MSIDTQSVFARPSTIVVGSLTFLVAWFLVIDFLIPASTVLVAAMTPVVGLLLLGWWLRPRVGPESARTAHLIALAVALPLGWLEFTVSALTKSSM